MSRARANAARFLPEQETPHHESWWLRANHPTEPRALWIRYTVHAPPTFAERIGELWACVLDGTTGAHAAVRTEVPIARVRLSSTELDVTIGEATLGRSEAHGHAHHAGRSLRWRLGWTGASEPLVLLGDGPTGEPFFHSRRVVAQPGIELTGTLEIDGHVLHVEGWRGSQGHGWGTELEHACAQGEVTGFVGASDVVLACASSRPSTGPLWAPTVSVLVVREGGRETRFDSLSSALLRSHASLTPGRWELEIRGHGARAHVALTAEPGRCVERAQPDLLGGARIERLTSLASCTLELERPGEPTRRLETAHGASFSLWSDPERR